MAAEMKTIQTKAHEFDGTDINKYSLMLGGLNVTHDVLQQYDPLITGYGRLFMVRKPLTLTKLMNTKLKYFKHILEYGNTEISGISDVSVESQQIQGGYTGKSFEIPTVAKDDTNQFSVKVYELSGSPIRELLHSWINTTTDIQSGLTHYGGLIASGELAYSQANHTAEFIYVETDRTGMKVEYACMFANCFPKGYKNDQFNFTAGTHDFVETTIEFSCTKYESIDINEKAYQLLKNYQILTNSLEFYSGLNDVINVNKDDSIINPSKGTGYDPKTGTLKGISSIDNYFIEPGQTSNKAGKNGQKFNTGDQYITPSFTMAGKDIKNKTQ